MQCTPTTSPRAPFLLALASIAFIGPLAIHSFLPVMPAVQKAFDMQASLAGMTFTVTLLVMACATLLYGSLSDRYGRRPVLLAGLALFTIGSCLCAFAESTTALIAGRVVQALGAGAAASLNRAIALDAYGPERLVKVLAYLTMAYTLGPMFAPLIGGILIDSFGWRSVFGFAALVGMLVGAAVWAVLYETHKPHAAAPTAAPRTGFFASAASLLRQPRFCAFVLQSGFSTGTFMALATAAAFLMHDYLARPATEFGHYFVMLPIGFLAGNFIASRVSARVGLEKMVLAGSLVMTIALSTQAVFIFNGYLNPLIIFIPGALLTFAQGLSLPNAQSGAMRLARGNAGAAAGLAVFFQMLIGAAGAQTYTLLADGTPTPMAITMLVGAALTLSAGTVSFLLRPRP